MMVKWMNDVITNSAGIHRFCNISAARCWRGESAYPLLLLGWETNRAPRAASRTRVIDLLSGSRRTRLW